MLDRLLELVRSGGTRTLKQLAQQLDTSESLVESMLDELVRLGYLKPLSSTCHATCQGCPGSNMCRLARSGRLWTLSEAGEKIAG